jgi:hypothetical protein
MKVTWPNSSKRIKESVQTHSGKRGLGGEFFFGGRRKGGREEGGWGGRRMGGRRMEITAFKYKGTTPTFIMLIFFLFLTFVIHQPISPGNNLNVGQSATELELMDDFPIKIDGGCSFFTFDTTSLDNGKYIFVINAHKAAFFRRNSEYVFVHHVKRQLKRNGYVDLFDGSGYKVVLDITKRQEISEYNVECTGVLKIFQKNKTTTIAVHGFNQEYTPK